MARKKVSEDIDILNDEELELSEANEEAEDLELSDDESEKDEEDEEDEAPAKAPKKNSRPKVQMKKEPLGFAAQLLKNSAEAKPEPAMPSRAKKEIKEEKAEIEVAPAEEIEAIAEEASEEETPAKKVRRPRSSPEEKGLSVAMESALEAMSSHWAKAKEATDALVSNLERVKKDLEEVKVSSAEPLQMLVNQTKEKQAVASRVTFALSLAAIIFSFVSLTLSQSVRGQLLGMAHSAAVPQREQVAQAPARPVRESAPVAYQAPQARQPQAPVAAPATLNPIPETSKSLARIPRKAAARVRK